MKYTSKSQQETINIGKKIATQLKGGDIVLLYGNLGAGKTTLTKGIAEGLGIKKDILSPTFTLMQLYQIRKSELSVIRKLIHIDTYRLEDENQLIEIGVEDYLGQPDTVCIIEWPEKMSPSLLSQLRQQVQTITLVFDYLDAHTRQIKFDLQQLH